MSLASPSRFMALLVFTVVFVVNPGYFAGCIGSEEEEPDFGEPEMLEVLDTANAMGPWRFESDGASYEAELVLVQKEGDDRASARRPIPFMARAHACGNRTFMQSAAACETLTTMPLEATLTLRRTDQEPAVEVVSELELEGELETFGLHLSNAMIHVAGSDHSLVLASSDARTFELASVFARGLGTASVDIEYSR